MDVQGVYVCVCLSVWLCARVGPVFVTVMSLSWRCVLSIYYCTSAVLSLLQVQEEVLTVIHFPCVVTCTKLSQNLA